MLVHVVEISVPVNVTMANAVGVLVFVLVKFDLQPAIEPARDASEGGEARHVRPGFKPANHRFRHAEPKRQLFLRFVAFDP